MAGRNRRFGQVFKDEAVRLVLDGPRPVSHVAKELGIHDTTLGNWVNAYRRTRGDDVAAQAAREKKSERELALERENRKLREENEFLKKAALDSDDQRNTARGWVDRGSDGSAGNVGRDERRLVAAVARR